MRRLVIGCAVLALLLAAGICVCALFCHIHLPIASLLEQAAALSAVGECREAEALSLQARQRWEAHQTFTAAFADHGPMDEIDSLFAQLETAHRPDLPGLYARLAALTRALTDSHRIYWWTIF